jgi:CHAT domain-containing protein
MRRAVDPDAMHASALVDLLWADSAGISLDRSITTLRLVSRLVDRPARAYTDLSAAYLVRAERRQDPRDLFEAAEAAARAVELEPRNAAAAFDLALALERSGIVDADSARTDAAPESDSLLAWTISDVEIDSLVARDPQRARVTGWDDALGAWGAARVRGSDPRADSALGFAARLGERLARTGDASLRDAVAAIRVARADERVTQRLARAHAAFSVGRVRYQAADYPGADSAFAQAIPDAAASPLLLGWAKIYRGTTLAYRGAYAAGLALLREVAGHTDSVAYPALAARARWSLGTTLLRRGRHDDGMASIEESESLFERIGERENLGGVRYVHADEAFSVGDDAEGYRYTFRALRELRGYRRSVWLHNTLSTGAQAFARNGLTRVAAIMQDEGIRVAERMSQPIYAIESLAYRALLRARAGNVDGARADVVRAAGRLGRVSSPAARAFLDADLQLALAVAATRERSGEALQTLDSAVRYFRVLKNPTRTTPALVARADAWLSAGHLDSAVADLNAAVALLDERGAGMNSPVQRAGFLDAARDVSDRLLMAQLATGRPVDALGSLERVRVSDSWRRPHAGGWVPRARAGETAIEYARVGDTLLVWAITDTVVHLTRTVVAATRLFHVIDAARSGLEVRTDQAALRDTLTLLYDWLIRPTERWLGGDGRTIVVVADGEIATVPFAALFDSVQGRYLVERYALRYAANLVEDRPRLAARSADPGTMLLVADPAFDSTRFPALARLRGAADEAKEVAALSPGAVVLEGSAATYRPVVAAMGRASVVHFAGHAVFDDAQPQQSYLVVAAAPGAADRITARDVGALDLRSVRLVVLAACRTLRAYGGRSGGVSGLAGAFLAAGAGGVVASDWLVDDELTRRLMTTFHRRYQATGDAANALRDAQLQVLRAGTTERRGLSTWTAFRYVGR